MRIGIFGSNYQSGKHNSVKELFDRLKENNAEIWVEKHFYAYLSEAFAFTPSITGLIEAENFSMDLVFSLGGDGTFLQTAARVGRQNIPILGINMGRLGFLADISPLEINETIDEIFNQQYRIEARSLLQMESSVNPGIFHYALNEIAFLKRDTSSMIAVYTYLNNVFLTEYLADGLLIATPTGSTAYNLSVNGPIIIPQSSNFVLSPVAAHSLNVRPLVIPEDYKIRLEVESRSKNFLISLDGRSEVFPSGSEFNVQKAGFNIQIIKRLHQDFYTTLRNKLMWGSDARKINE
ncbi:MAG: NAD kinase [Candidatus Ordinivivax streblomastigis]|uniref:NAD kinase n=1 Tax=Candidatus Ordinivivax streblomastigis TaxID=2540710 RepID=A0A5M8P2P7_9BACT|nr:MAG: NAD kinase [Candidatus Ordinivivax streblomastigis]